MVPIYRNNVCARSTFGQHTWKLCVCKYDYLQSYYVFMDVGYVPIHVLWQFLNATVNSVVCYYCTVLDWTPLSVTILRGVVITRLIFSKFLRYTPRSSPMRARYGVSIEFKVWVMFCVCHFIARYNDAWYMAALQLHPTAYHMMSWIRTVCLHMLTSRPHYWPFVRGIRRILGDSPTKGQWCGPMFLFSLALAWTNNRAVDDQREVGTRFASLIFANMRLANLVATSRWYADEWRHHNARSVLIESKINALGSCYYQIHNREFMSLFSEHQSNLFWCLFLSLYHYSRGYFSSFHQGVDKIEWIKPP